MKKTIKWLLIGIIILLLLGGFYVFGKYVVFPSYLSVKYACTNVSIEEMQEQGYTIAGIYRPSTNQIIIYDADPMTFKHEKCHYYQNLKGNLNNCSNQFLLFLDEIQCYTVQYLPDKIYNSLYL